MVHLVIKELASSAEDIIMVTATIMKDTGGGTEAIYRPNAIRALCRIIDVRDYELFRRQKYINLRRALRSKVSNVS
jgi:coatomer protein complex subunit gamma